jgi:hypothetical protein
MDGLNPVAFPVARAKATTTRAPRDDGGQELPLAREPGKARRCSGA